MYHHMCSCGSLGKKCRFSDFDGLTGIKKMMVVSVSGGDGSLVNTIKKQSPSYTFH